MSFTRANPTGWGTGSIFTSSQCNQIDQDHANAADKSTANDTIVGTWTFSASTSGIVLSGTTAGIESGLAGGVRSTVAGGIQLAGGSTDWPTFSAVRTRLVQVGGDLVAGVTDSLVPQGGGFAANWGMYSANAPKIPGLSGGMITTAVNTATANVYGYYLPLASALHNGATLTSATLQMIGASGHTALPATMPAFGIFRYSISGGTGFQALASGSGYAVDPTTVLSTYNGYHAWSQALNQNNVIDRTAYGYAAVIWDEGYTNALAGNVYLGVSLSYGSIADMRFP